MAGHSAIDFCADCPHSLRRNRAAILPFQRTIGCFYELPTIVCSNPELFCIITRHRPCRAFFFYGTISSVPSAAAWRYRFSELYALSATAIFAQLSVSNCGASLRSCAGSTRIYAAQYFLLRVSIATLSLTGIFGIFPSMRRR